MSTVRNVELYILSPGLNYEELEGAGQGRDLKELAEVGDNVK